MDNKLLLLGVWFISTFIALYNIDRGSLLVGIIFGCLSLFGTIVAVYLSKINSIERDGEEYGW